MGREMGMLEWLLSRLRRGIAFVRLLFGRFVADRGLLNAGSLTYTTLLSLVPLMAVTLAIFSAFPISGRVVQEIQDFVFRNFVPASGEVVQSYLLEFSGKASRLSGVGFAFLVVVAVMMMVNIDHAINAIWRVRRKRSPLAMFLMYWAILTLGPLLIGISMAATSFLVSMPLFSDTAAHRELRGQLLSLMPLLSSMIAFTLLYAIVPNRRVPFRHALAGGVLAALLFELAKRGFAFYITNFPTYEAIYGALAVIPIFLVWIYLSWVIALLGAEFSYCLAVFRDQGWHGREGEGGDFLLAYRVLHELWRGQQAGRALATERLAGRLGHVPEERLERLLIQLEQASLVLLSEDGEWVLARDLNRFTLLDLYQARPFVLPRPALLDRTEGEADLALKRILERLDQDLAGTMGVALAVLFLEERT